MTSPESGYSSGAVNANAKHTRTESLNEDVQMAATCTRKKWIIGIFAGALLLVFILAIAISVPLAAAAAVGEAKLAVDPCAGYNCTVCPCRQNSTCVPSTAGTATCVSGPVLPDGSSCNDGDPSTMKDICKGGVCKGVPLTCAGVDCSGGYYGFDACHGAAQCELMDGATNCVPHTYENGYVCNRGRPSEGQCWKGTCLVYAEYNRSVARDPCRMITCPPLPLSNTSSLTPYFVPPYNTDCFVNGSGTCNFDGSNVVCGYKPAEVNTPCTINGTAGVCGAFGNCRLPSSSMGTAGCPQ